MGLVIREADISDAFLNARKRVSQTSYRTLLPANYFLKVKNM
jgi:hypothetical protein